MRRAGEMRMDERNQVKVSGHPTLPPEPVENLLPPSLRSVASEDAELSKRAAAKAQIRAILAASAERRKQTS